MSITASPKLDQAAASPRAPAIRVKTRVASTPARACARRQRPAEHVPGLGLVACEPQRDVGLDGRRDVGRPAEERCPRPVLALLRADPARGRLGRARLEDAQVEAQKQILGVDGDVRLREQAPSTSPRRAWSASRRSRPRSRASRAASSLGEAVMLMTPITSSRAGVADKPGRRARPGQPRRRRCAPRPPSSPAIRSRSRRPRGRRRAPSCAPRGAAGGAFPGPGRKVARGSCVAVKSSTSASAAAGSRRAIAGR